MHACNFYRIPCHKQIYKANTVPLNTKPAIRTSGKQKSLVKYNFTFRQAAMMALSSNHCKLFLLCCWVVLFFHTAIEVQARAVPRLKLTLLSEESGKYIVVNESGEVKAIGRWNDPAAHFYPTFLDGYIRFESVLYPGKYLLVEETDNVTQLAAGVPIDLQGSGMVDYSSHEWEQIYLSDPVKSAFKVTGSNGTECFLAFDKFGEVVGPCVNVTAYDSVASLRYRLV